MAFRKYRPNQKVFNDCEPGIERFVYDVLAYTLSICGLPKAIISTKFRKENTYTDKYFIMNVGLSVLPIALYLRDDWKSAFDKRFEETGFNNITDIQEFLELILENHPDYEEEDILTKLQLSLALYNEIILYLNYKNVETFVDELIKSWNDFNKNLINEEFEPLAHFRMCPEVTETCIVDFVRKEAIPYGRVEAVSDKFCEYSFKMETEDNSFNETLSLAEREFSVHGSGVSDNNLESSLEKDSDSSPYFVPIREDFLDIQRQVISSNKVDVGTRTHVRSKKGLGYVLKHSLKKRKRNESLERVENEFKMINLEKDDNSPENEDNKRRRKIFRCDELE